ncbi:mechanosensitive ion channel family protein [Massilia glaciei]|uniref:Mechanosensitive ion channel family protein n=1 Tax=Massilia glaciei TaxID=1524097 RepID=A0A2U2HGE2_9BURK|nr:mechanosensitive ion channel family protein [Massilia glaciei]PWF44000.1 mechanosensitive ion channel family protein [Massilia glaciei]
MDYLVFGNDALAWGIAAALALAALALLYGGKHLVLTQLGRIASRTDSHLDDIAVCVLASTARPFMWAVALYAGTQALALPPKAQLYISNGIILAVLLQVALWGDLAVKEWLTHYRNARQGDDPASTTSTAALGFVARAIIWLVLVLTILDNFGVDVTTLIASLGIGGIAVALALQNILGDLFSSLSIVLDKPFVVGDFIIVDGVAGSVEYVGLKTTRLRSLGGEQVIFSNSDLLKSRIHNYKRMESRRIAFCIGVTYQTTAQQLRALPGMIGEIIKAQQNVRFDRAHFKSFGASSLDFEVVYIVASADYALYMDLQQAINLALFERLGDASIEFAYPTQTLHHVAVDPGPAPAKAPASHAFDKAAA